MSSQPIQLVTFDLYDTLIESHPARWERLHAALAKLAVPADLESLRAADLVVEDFYTEQNTRKPIRDRDAAELEAFRLDYLRRWLEAAAIPHDEERVRVVRRAYVAEFESYLAEGKTGAGYRVFADVVPTLRRLHAMEVRTAVISNADSDVTELCMHFAFAHEMDLIVTSALVGWEKPDVRTFRAALDPLGVAAENALHIGDQPRSDVAGAKAAGMRAALIDRYARHRPESQAVPIFVDFNELVEHVAAVNAGAMITKS